MEQNRELRNKPRQLWSINLKQRRQKYTMKKRQCLQQVVWESWTTSCKSVKLECSLPLYTEINLKWCIDLKVRHDTIKLLEENIGKTFSDINCSNIFLDQSPKAKEIKAKINKWDLIVKLTSF